MSPMPESLLPMSPIADHNSGGGRLISLDGRVLPLRHCRLVVEARGGIARTVLEQAFANPYDEPLMVTYLLPLPADGAVSGFAFRIGDRRIVGEVDRKAAARERFEQAIVEGRTAGLVEQERSSLFTQELGNIPPRTEVVAELTIDQRLAWLHEGAWEYRFPTTVAPRYLGGPGEVPDAARITVDVASGPTRPRLQLALTLGDAVTGAPFSPSHGLQITSEDDSQSVRFSDEGGVPLDRDVVVRWPVAQAKPGVVLSTSRRQASSARASQPFGLLTIVPPSVASVASVASPASAASAATAMRAVRRDLIVLIDTSGSMGGEPLEQARRVVSALIATLGDEDQLELIEFSDEPRRWKRAAVAATAKEKNSALSWLAGLRASSSTEMQRAIVEALHPLRDGAQRQIVLVSDGLIGSEEALIGTILRDLPSGSRLHTVGVGSSVNRSLTGPAARAGRGVEVVIGLGEDPERAARQLVARTAAPVLVELSLAGSALVEHAPQKLPDLYGGAPFIAALALHPEGGELIVSARTDGGSWSQRIEVPSVASGTGHPGIAALFARESVEDLEMQHAARFSPTDDLRIEQLGCDFQIATRLTSWVAISDEATTDSRQPFRRETMPHMLPHGMSAGGLGLRQAGPPSFAATGSHGQIRTSAMSVSSAAFSALIPPPPAARPQMVGSARMPGAPSPFAFKSESRTGAALMPHPITPAPASPAEDTPAKKGGILSATLERVGHFFHRFGSTDDAAFDAADEGLLSDAVVFEDLAPARRTVRGRIALRRGRELVIEITLGEELDWVVPAKAELLVDGRAVSATIDVRRTTLAGHFGPGQVLRIALQLDSDDTGLPREMHIEGPMNLVVEL